MGADGGVVYIPVRGDYPRVEELLKPFWQFLCKTSCCSWGEDAHWAWENANPTIDAPEYLVGYYGTDRCDSFTLDDIHNLCYPWDDRPDLYELTFDELDMDCRTQTPPIKGSYDEPILHRLWYQHFQWISREETLAELGPLANMTIKEWAGQLKQLLDLDKVVSVETWT